MVELLSGQGKDPVARWKLSGGPAAIQKVSELHSCSAAQLLATAAHYYEWGHSLSNSVRLYATVNVRIEGSVFNSRMRI